MSVLIDKKTIQKFDIQGPRYTSYPTAPAWTEDVTESIYKSRLKAFGETTKTLSLYVHIPFCESMCTFCGCSTVIRRQDRKHSDRYLNYLLKEIDLVADAIAERKTIRQFHWGGGTPTFFRNDQIENLFAKVAERFDIALDSEIAIEIDPRTIDEKKLNVLHALGFNRISMGVQDFDRRVQEAVNRIQPFDLVKKHYEYCRDLKFDSINFDLIYGLPFQTQKSFQDAIEKVVSLKPDRIALYSFAYVPWLKKHQMKLEESTLPSSDEKLDIFLMARQLLLDHDYEAIAMDHFALRDDELAKAYSNNNLYRNFMGYTVKPADEYVGVGMSSIGFLEKTYIQNKKTLPSYYAMLDGDRLPVERGKNLSTDDEMRQFVINSLMCHFELDKDEFFTRFHVPFDSYFQVEEEHIQKCLEDELIIIENNVIKVNELGKLFVRNVCMGFDFYLQQQQQDKQQFSRTV